MSKTEAAAEEKKSEAKPAKEAPKAHGARRHGKLSIIFLTILFLSLVVLIRHTFLFLIVALLPTIVAYIVDRTPTKSMFQSVMACNMAGMLPYLAKLIDMGNSPGMVQTIMGDMLVWLIIYSAAGIGWCMVWLWPHVAYFLINMMALKETLQLELAQRWLTEEWGPEIKRKE